MVVGTMWSSSGIIITAAALLAQTPLAISNDTNGGRIVNSTLPIYNDDAYPVVFRRQFVPRRLAVVHRGRAAAAPGRHRPWEGLSDLFRDVTNRGGIAQPGFIEAVGTTSSGRGLVEDLARMMLREQLITPYWEDKEARLERVQVPAYVVAIYTNALHTRGTFEGFRRIQSAARWLRVHNSYEWPDYYLKNITDNGRDETPRVRMAALDPGASDTLDRTAEDWPPQGIQTRSFFLAANGSLVNDNPASESSVSYAVNGSSTSGQAQFQYQVREHTEIWCCLSYFPLWVFLWELIVIAYPMQDEILNCL